MDKIAEPPLAPPANAPSHCAPVESRFQIFAVSVSCCGNQCVKLLKESATCTLSLPLTIHALRRSHGISSSDDSGGFTLSPDPESDAPYHWYIGIRELIRCALLATNIVGPAHLLCDGSAAPLLESEKKAFPEATAASSISTEQRRTGLRQLIRQLGLTLNVAREHERELLLSCGALKKSPSASDWVLLTLADAKTLLQALNRAAMADLISQHLAKLQSSVVTGHVYIPWFKCGRPSETGVASQPRQCASSCINSRRLTLGNCDGDLSDSQADPEDEEVSQSSDDDASKQPSPPRTAPVTRRKRNVDGSSLVFWVFF